MIFCLELEVAQGVDGMFISSPICVYLCSSVVPLEDAV